jgi:hypothetical protein
MPAFVAKQFKHMPPGANDLRPEAGVDLSFFRSSSGGYSNREAEALGRARKYFCRLPLDHDFFTTFLYH